MNSTAHCLKCNAPSPYDWTRCQGVCVIPWSPHFSEETQHRTMLASLPPPTLREQFEAQASDPSHKFRRSHKGTYVNPAVARDWKWFQLGVATKTVDTHVDRAP